MAWVRTAIRSTRTSNLRNSSRSNQDGGAHTVEDTGNLAEESTDPFSTVRNLNIQQLFNGEGVAQFVRHWAQSLACEDGGCGSITHGDIIESVEIREGLGVSLVFDELLCSTVQKTDMLQQLQ